MILDDIGFLWILMDSLQIDLFQNNRFYDFIRSRTKNYPKSKITFTIKLCSLLNAKPNPTTETKDAW